MTLSASAYQIRPATVQDIPAMFHVRASTRENAIAPERLAALGLTPASLREAMAAGDLASWSATLGDELVGFCGADARLGEVTVLAILAGHEGRGLGRALLDQAVAHLQAAGCDRIWLAAGADAALRSHGFYRAQGWRPSGLQMSNGDEELVYQGRDPAGP